MLVSRVLGQTKKIRKTAADIFTSFGVEKPWIKNVGKSSENLEKICIFPCFFQRFSSPDFAKISAAVLRIFSGWSRAPETDIWPISSFVWVFFFRVLTPTNIKIQLFRSFLREQALKPCPDYRSRRELSNGGRITSLRPNLTDLVSKQGPDFHRRR